ncbi:FxsB family cyclophane-forming radical SAM/SPASM peptide maturase [Streptosporangium sp. CA-135522]|uniref:FxsB family cyclophane-forming radical SAM/SPASM peptide maturase n=1 Tax=Streptosporangium sp. CA-135522 TaxID=3240072 RepID=UPI003D90975C
MSATLAESGWSPPPFRQFILKVHSRCNLSCDYCYVYEMADQSWQRRPTVMSPEILEQAARRIAEHAVAHGLDEVEIVFHGGEPLLAGAPYLDRAATTLRRVIPCRVRMTVQTNGLLLSDAMLRVLAEHEISVGVSMDGGREAQDRHRVYASGRGSYSRVAARLRKLLDEPYRPLFGGILCTIDVANDPVDVYESLLEFQPPGIDFLLPHGNWTEPPPGLSPGSTATPYADWLIAIFDRWYGAPEMETNVRLFQEIMNLLFGGQSRSESIGLSPITLLVIDTDGTIEQVDTLKSAFDGAAETGLDVLGGDFDTALGHHSLLARQVGLGALSETCMACPVRDVCGGGYYPHRYRAGTGFRNPSVFCADLFKLITHIRERLLHDVRSLSA